MDEETRQEFSKVWQKISELEKMNNKFVEEDVNTSLHVSDALFDIEGELLTVIKVSGNNTEEKTQNITLLTLLGYKERLNKEKVLASEIRRNVAINKIPIENFGTYVNELIPQSILRIGKAKSKQVAYKLTNFGNAKAKELQKEIFKDEQSE